MVPILEIVHIGFIIGAVGNQYNQPCPCDHLY